MSQGTDCSITAALLTGETLYLVAAHLTSAGEDLWRNVPKKILAIVHFYKGVSAAAFSCIIGPLILFFLIGASNHGRSLSGSAKPPNWFMSFKAFPSSSYQDVRTWGIILKTTSWLNPIA